MIELAKSTDIMQRTVINLKESNQRSGLTARKLYRIILEEISEYLLPLYYRLIKENKQELLNHWIGKEAVNQTYV